MVFGYVTNEVITSIVITKCIILTYKYLFKYFMEYIKLYNVFQTNYVLWFSKHLVRSRGKDLDVFQWVPRRPAGVNLSEMLVLPLPSSHTT